MIKKFTSNISFFPSPWNGYEPWATHDAFEWELVYNQPEHGRIVVMAGFYFDGASVPALPFLRLLFPKVHPKYMQSAALHDWCLKYERHRFSRNDIDLIFRQALIAQGNPKWRVNGMYLGVSLFGKLTEWRDYYRVKEIV